MPLIPAADYWRIYCKTSKQWEFIWSTIEPVVCPVNATHLVNLNSTQINDTIDIELDMLDSNIHEIHHNQTILQYEIQDLEANQTLLDYEMEDMQANASVLQYEIQDLEANQSLLDYEIEDMQSNVSVLQYEIQDLKANQTLLQYEIQDLEANQTLLNYEIQDLEVNQTLLDYEMEDMQYNMTIAQYDIQNLQANTTTVANTTIVGFANTSIYNIEMYPGYQIINGTQFTPNTGNYIIFYNTQFNMDNINLAIVSIASQYLHNILLNISPTITHGVIYGYGEILTPGVYSTVAAITPSGILTLNGPGKYIFIITGAVTSDASFNMNLINGATAENVFWDIVGAPTIGGSFIGTIISPGTIVVSINAIITGRLIAIAANSITLNSNNINLPVPGIPDETSPLINIGEIVSFALFTNGGGIINSGITTINGNVGINSIVTPTDTGTLSINGNLYSSENTIFRCDISLGIYKNGIEIQDTTREITVRYNSSGIISLQSFIISILTGDTIDVRFASISVCNLTIGPQNMIIMPVA